jgi:hypothetical protein
LFLEPTIRKGVGRPPRKPIGIFKALIVKRVKQIPSDRELCRRLWTDPDLREICDIEAEQKPYHPTQLTRFRNRVGIEKLEKIRNSMINELLKSKLISGKTVVLDADPEATSRWTRNLSCLWLLLLLSLKRLANVIFMKTVAEVRGSSH